MGVSPECSHSRPCSLPGLGGFPAAPGYKSPTSERGISTAPTLSPEGSQVSHIVVTAVLFPVSMACAMLGLWPSPPCCTPGHREGTVTEQDGDMGTMGPMPLSFPAPQNPVLQVTAVRGHCGSASPKCHFLFSSSIPGTPTPSPPAPLTSTEATNSEATNSKATCDGKSR